MAKTGGKLRNLGWQAHEELPKTVLSETDPQHSDVNLPADQRLEVAQVEREAYTFHISTEDAAQITGCSRKETAEADLVTHWLLDGALKVMAHGAKEPDFSKLLPVQKTLLLNSEPRTPVEAMLITQMIAAHEMAMSFTDRAISEQNSAMSESFSSRAERLMTLFTRQAECLQKLKGLSGQQRVVVEHLNVTAGGKAVVGQVLSNREQEK